MINLFLDSNIWLDLFHFSSNDLEEFAKLNDNLNKDIMLFMPDQVVFEIQRNRDAKISDALKRFKDLRPQIPNLCMGYQEYTTFSKLLTNLSQVHKELCQKIELDVANKSLPADHLINKVYQNSKRLVEKPEIIQSAELRFKRGNPPGKNNSLGDAINWESLLFYVPKGEDLFFVSGDKDYQSPMDNNKMNLFLITEWQRSKNAEVRYYPSLVSFLREHQRDINLKSEMEKESLIEGLYNSGSFAHTHSLIANLEKFEHFSEKQINQLVRAAVDNDQVGSIIADSDVARFYRDLLAAKEDKIEDNPFVRALLGQIGISLPDASTKDAT